MCVFVVLVKLIYCPCGESVASDVPVGAEFGRQSLPQFWAYIALPKTTLALRFGEVNNIALVTIGSAFDFPTARRIEWKMFWLFIHFYSYFDAAPKQ